MDLWQMMMLFNLVQQVLGGPNPNPNPNLNPNPHQVLGGGWRRGGYGGFGGFGRRPMYY